ncbi:MAG: hypothetical protein C4533_04725 [Candidatus Omnitrophota bacterium]|jgi:predicted RNA-binding protein with PIN domain|nr:MAG: hypothetical protein C4533_04725 [Candidatus Omnitrophota bacterium]
MSLLYVIDGYNVLNHPAFKENSPKTCRDNKLVLINLIKNNSLTGSARNLAFLIFDGFPNMEDKNNLAEDYGHIKLFFSRQITADEYIKRIAEKLKYGNNLIVVSDDRQIRDFINSLGSKAMGVGEFINIKAKKPAEDDPGSKQELNYMQIKKINEELKGLWLRE